MKTINSYQVMFCLKLLIILLLPTAVFSQDLTGLWTGKVYTTDKTLPYEVAISQKDGKLVGFSYTTFTVKGEEMVAVKSIVVRKEKDNIIIEDEDLVFNSFDEESPKQLKQTNTLVLTVNGSTMLLTGNFKTLKTKQFRSLTGGIRLRKDSIIEQPRLIAKLDEMNLSKSLSFIAPKSEPETAIARIEKVETAVVKVDEEVKEKSVVAAAKATAPAMKPTVAPLKTTPVVVKPPVATVVKPAAPVPAASVRKPVTVAAAKPAIAAKPAPKPPSPVAVVVAPPTPPTPIAKPKPETKAPASSFASNIGNRTIETIQTVVFKSDSLTLTLYDNGEVDGDTVSVILNGNTILSKQRLSTNAITKTIYFTPEMGDSLQLIMYAENLGSLPPNTGLLIIKDGRDRYEIRFAGDLTKNAAIILRRRGT